MAGPGFCEEPTPREWRPRQPWQDQTLQEMMRADFERLAIIKEEKEKREFDRITKLAKKKMAAVVTADHAAGNHALCKHQGGGCFNKRK